jgi:hypothetical protein
MVPQEPRWALLWTLLERLDLYKQKHWLHGVFRSDRLPWFEQRMHTVLYNATTFDLFIHPQFPRATSFQGLQRASARVPQSFGHSCSRQGRYRNNLIGARLRPRTMGEGSTHSERIKTKTVGVKSI